MVPAVVEQMGLPESWIGLIFRLATVVLYAGIGIMSRAANAAEYYDAGRRVPAFYNGLATGADWMSAASFIGMAGTLYLTGFGGLAEGMPSRHAPAAAARGAGLPPRRLPARLRRLFGATAAAAPQRCAVLDVEASGPDAKHCWLIAIAAVAMQLNGWQARIALGDSFEIVLRQPEVKPDRAKILLHGIGVGAQRHGVEPRA